MKVSPLIDKNVSFLQNICKPKNTIHLIQRATDEQLLCLVEICLNILKGRLPLKPQHLKKLRKHAQILRRLARTRTSRSAKNLLLQQGNGLPAIASLVARIVLPIISNLVEKYK